MEHLQGVHGQNRRHGREQPLAFRLVRVQFPERGAELAWTKNKIEGFGPDTDLLVCRAVSKTRLG